jgi:hypothetical protein
MDLRYRREFMENAQKMRFSRKIEDFSCKKCGAKVKGTGYTDHCPNCLWSMHVDINPGDRSSKCIGMMKPMSTQSNRNGFIIEYLCIKCGAKKRIGAAADDNKELLFDLLK